MRIIIPVICVLGLAGSCFAQMNSTETETVNANRTRSLTVTTYYPAPHAVFRNIQLSPTNTTPTGTGDPFAGTMYYNSTTKKPYIYNGSSWIEFGSAGSYIYQNITSPDRCSGTVSTNSWNNGQLCSVPWHQNITFETPFRANNTTHVMVFPLEVPDKTNSPCANNATDQFVSFPRNITAAGFVLYGAGSPIYEPAGIDQDYCSNNTNRNLYNQWFTRAKVLWFAISE